MKIKNIFLLFSILAISSCSTYWSKSWRKPSSLNYKNNDLLESSQLIIDKVATREISSQTCANDLDSLIEIYDKAPASINMDAVKNQGQEILDQSFEARMAIHSMLSTLSNECKAKVKKLYLKMRMTEDYIGIHHYNDPQISADSIKYQEGPVPILEAEKYHPYHVGNGVDPKAKFEFKNGDIMITKGVSFVSSTISELASPKSLFSHIVFVHVDSKTKELTTIES
jgi:hypothetical protein